MRRHSSVRVVKKLGVVIAGTVGLVLSLAGCGGSSTSTAKVYYSAPWDRGRIIIQGNKFTMQPMTSTLIANRDPQNPNEPSQASIRKSKCYWDAGGTVHGIIKNNILYVTSTGSGGFTYEFGDGGMTFGPNDTYQVVRLPGQLRFTDQGNGDVVTFTTQNPASWMHKTMERAFCGHW